MKPNTHIVHRIIAEISSTGTSAKRLTVTSWGNGEPKLDLRIWRTDINPPIPKRGITLTDVEADALAEALLNRKTTTEKPDI